MTIAYAHHGVMTAEVVNGLAPRADGVYLDGTFGRGGWTRAILAAAPCAVIAIDRDEEAATAAEALAAENPGRLSFIRGRFGDMARLLAERGVTQLAGIALDLGVSSPQIDNPARGFSFRFDGPLDMRMGRDGPSAADLVAEMAEEELANLIYRLGEERLSRRVAHAIVVNRAETPIETTGQLAAIIRRVVPKSADGVDPATRTFQALRIAVNDELGELDRGLAAAETLLAPGGRLAIVSFHSLEDRRVKQFLAERTAGGAGVSRHAPAAARRAPSFRSLSNKALRAGPAEVSANPRARTARLRLAERLPAPELRV
ncbi:MAG: 16S rRNA (cytosine(1402)-N(4))-methyltransferase RsmH [Elsteraceae bacterium]